MMTKVARAIRGLSLGIWLGGGVMTFIVAQEVFFGGHLQSHEEAGDLMGAILHIGGWLKFGLAILALAAQFMLRDDPASGPKARKTALISLAIAALLVCVAVFYLEPTLVDLRAQFRGNLENAAHAKFKSLHGASMGLSLLELILVTLALICAVI
jgi:hypothetical protein